MASSLIAENGSTAMSMDPRWVSRQVTRAVSKGVVVGGRMIVCLQERGQKINLNAPSHIPNAKAFVRERILAGAIPC